jgi:hypothetical protein
VFQDKFKGLTLVSWIVAYLYPIMNCWSLKDNSFLKVKRPWIIGSDVKMFVHRFGIRLQRHLQQHLVYFSLTNSSLLYHSEENMVHKLLIV